MIPSIKNQTPIYHHERLDTSSPSQKIERGWGSTLSSLRPPKNSFFFSHKKTLKNYLIQGFVAFGVFAFALAKSWLHFFLIFALINVVKSFIHKIIKKCAK